MTLTHGEDSRLTAALLSGLLGCICMGVGDWLMIYGDTTAHGSVHWLTEGAVWIAPWRNGLAMFLAFPGVLFYGIALFALASLLLGEGRRKTYRRLTAFGMMPWLCLHLYIVMVLYAFGWMSRNGYERAALPVAEAMQRQYVWLVVLSEAVMVLPFLYWSWAVAWGGSALPRGMALSNPLVFYGLWKVVSLGMPEGAFHLAFTNGLMSESMAVWFGSLLLWERRWKK